MKKLLLFTLLSISLFSNCAKSTTGTDENNNCCIITKSQPSIGYTAYECRSDVTEAYCYNLPLNDNSVTYYSAVWRDGEECVNRNECDYSPGGFGLNE